MTDGHDRNYESGVDREIHLKGIVVTAVVLAIIVVASAALMLWMSKGLRTSLKSSDPPPPVLLEAQVQEPPPEPRLQTDPADDMALMRAEEETALESYAWVDEAAGIARVPIGRAMEMVAAGQLAAGQGLAGAPAPVEPGAPAESEPRSEDPSVPVSAVEDAGE